MRGAEIMNLIVLCRSRVATRHLSLSPFRLVALAASLGALFAGSFGLGYGAGSSRAELLRAGTVPAAPAVPSAQQRTTMQNQIDALALRLGELNANVIRLNALGARLTELAGLDDGEFDFSDPPGRGGPADITQGSWHIDGLTDELDSLMAAVERQEQQLDVLADLMVHRKLREDARPRGLPVDSGYVSSYFGRRADPFTGKIHFHRGLDFAAKTGTRVLSVGLGVVTWAGHRPGYGRMVEITHADGYVTRYAHNAKNLVAVGDHVDPGQTIALIGASGRATGPNLHFEVWKGGRPVDPVRFIRQRT